MEAENILKMNIGDDFKVLVFESIGDIELIKNNPNIDIAVNDFAELKEFIKAGIPSNRMQLKIDLGFGRNGIAISEIPELGKFTTENNLKYKGIFSHLLL